MLRLCLLIFIFMVGCSTPNTASNDAINQEINDFLQKYYQTMSARNWEAYRQFFWDNAVLSTIWQTQEDSVASVKIFTIDEFIDQTSEGPDSQPIFEEKMLEADVEVKLNLARAWVNYAAKFGSEDSLSHWTGTDLFTLMQHNEEWKIVSLAFSAD